MKSKFNVSDKLPKHFHKDLFYIETQFEIYPRIMHLKELLLLYKKAIEYHSDKSELKKQAYQLKIHLLVTNKIVTKLFQQENEQEYITTRESTQKDVLDFKKKSKAAFNLKLYNIMEQEKEDWDKYILNFELNMDKELIYLILI